MKARGIALAFFCFGLALLGASSAWWLKVLAVVLMVAAALAFRPTLRGQAFLRLDHFLPFANKRWQRSGPVSALNRLAKRLLPASWFFNPETGRDGKLRRWCRRMGPTVLSAPFRRLVQTACLLVFLWLFFYVCWPYGARPVAPGEVSPGWKFDGVEQATGNLRFLHESKPSWLKSDSQVWLSEDLAGTVEVSARIRSLSPDGLLLTASDQTSFLVKPGPWTISERPRLAWPSHYADHLARRETIPAETFLAIDPLLSFSTALAARAWVWSLVSAGVILFVCVLIPRGFCGYVCPLGTVIDLFDWLVSKRIKRFRVTGSGWWVHIKYYLLLAVLIAALGGVLLSGFVAAIPIITRAMLFLGEPAQSAGLRDWHLVAPMNIGHVFSLSLFLAVLALGLLQPRFWCKYLCPSGAVFSLGNLFRATERKVESSCIHCNKCVDICPFDAIKPDFTTRILDCTLCQTCGGVCPTHSIKFVDRWNAFDLKEANQPPTRETRLGRRGFVSWAVGGASAVVTGLGAAAVTRSWGARLDDPAAPRPVRPPGSVPEQEFLQMCIRCGECFKACPNNVLQPLGFQQGLEGLWTPQVVADWAGCESSCNACGQVCPTGAIRALPLEEKKVARMGLAVVDQTTCLPYAGREACQLCVDDCAAAGYHAIEFTRVHTRLDTEGNPIPESGFVAPVVLADECVGCGLCQTRCHGVNAEAKSLLKKSAIVVFAGEGKEDRLISGSYIELRSQERAKKKKTAPTPVVFPLADDPFAEDQGR